MTKVRHWHSKHVFTGLLEGLKRGRTKVLLSIVWDVSILHRMSARDKLQLGGDCSNRACSSSHSEILAAHRLQG